MKNTHKTPLYEIIACAAIGDIPTATWDALHAPAAPLHTHRFSRVVEEAGVENAVFQYVVIKEGEQVVATAVFSAFSIDLGLFLGKNAEKWLVRLRRIIPGFLKIRILVCGLPASFGQQNLAFAENADRAACLRLLVQEMEKNARQNRIRYLCFKEFQADEAERLAPLETSGYFRAPSLPDTVLDISHWNNFSEYLAALRSPYRRKIVLSMKKLCAGVALETNAGGCSPEDFYRLYLSVMSRAETKLETLNLAFFQKMYAYYDGELVVLTLRRSGDLLGAALLLPAGDTLIWLLVGQEAGRSDETDTYFNLVYGILDYAFRHGFKKIKMGQTAYPLKLRLGARPQELFLFFKATNPAKHLMLRTFKNVLFPATKLPQLRVFST